MFLLPTADANHADIKDSALTQLHDQPIKRIILVEHLPVHLVQNLLMILFTHHHLDLPLRER